MHTFQSVPRITFATEYSEDKRRVMHKIIIISKKLTVIHTVFGLIITETCDT